MSDKSSNINNPALNLILCEIRTNLFFLSPLIEHYIKLAGETIHGDPKSDYEYILTQIEDAIELSKNIDLTKSTICEVNLHQLAQDFAQGYGRKFSTCISSLVTIIFDTDLPLVNSYPDRLIRIFDSLLRSAQKAGVKKPVELIVRKSRSILQDKKKIELVITCKGISFNNDRGKTSELLINFAKGEYLKCIRDFGLELCTALHITRYLGGKFSLLEDKYGNLKLELRIQFDKCSHQPKIVSVPHKIKVISESNNIIHTIKGFCEYYGNEYESLTFDSLKNTNKERFIIDGTTLQPEQVIKELKQINAALATVILPTLDEGCIHKYYQIGLRSFISLPLVSTKLFECLCGNANYIAPVKVVASYKKSKLKILLVDDIPTARIVLRNYFEDEGHVLVEINDGSEMIELIKSGEKFDLIFCDHAMSYIDGSTAIEQVRQLEVERGYRTPIVLVTAYAPLDSEVSHIDCDKVLIKPVDISKIPALISKLLAKDNHSKFPAVTDIIDLADLLKRCANKNSIALKVLNSFIESANQQLQKLRTYSNQDKVLYLKSLHALKGLFREIGYPQGTAKIEEYERSSEILFADPKHTHEIELLTIKAINAVQRLIASNRLL